MSAKDEGGRAFLVIDGKVYEGRTGDDLWACNQCDRNPKGLCGPSTTACTSDPRMRDKVWKLKIDGKVT